MTSWHCVQQQWCDAVVGGLSSQLYGMSLNPAWKPTCFFVCRSRDAQNTFKELIIQTLPLCIAAFIPLLLPFVACDLPCSHTVIKQANVKGTTGYTHLLLNKSALREIFLLFKKLISPHHNIQYTLYIILLVFAHISPPPNYPASFFLSLFVHVPLCCVSVRSAAPDFHKLNEDGELWLVNQGLKETIRCNSSVMYWACFAFSQGRMCAAVFLHPQFFSLSLSLSHTFFVKLSEFSLTLSCVAGQF